MTLGIESSSQFYVAHSWLQTQSLDEVFKQESLPEMVNDFMDKCKVLEKKTVEFEKDITAHADLTADLRAAQAALETFLTEHPDLEGDINMDTVMVFLPETSPLRTGQTEEVSVRTLMNYYKTAQKSLQLPEMPEIVSVSDIKQYQASLDRAVVTASSYFDEAKQSQLSEIASRRQGLLDLMAEIIKTYSQLLRSGVERR